MPPRRPRPTVPAFLLDPIQAQALVHELLAAHDAIPAPEPSDPMRHLVATRKAQLSHWALELSAAFGDYAALARNEGPQAEEFQRRTDGFAAELAADTAEQH
jgi:hypothetical protein